MQDRGMEPVITDPSTGEDIYIEDLLVGLDSLPNRQRQAFELICLRGYTETAARDILLPNSKSSTPVQQYADSALGRMVTAYDLKQAGQWPPPEQIKKSTTAEIAKAKPRKTRVSAPSVARKIMSVLNPTVKKYLQKAEAELEDQLAEVTAALAEVRVLLGPSENTSNGTANLTEMAKDLAATG